MSDGERDLLARDTQPSSSAIPTLNVQNSSQLGSDKFLQHFAQMLDTKLEQKLESFKRSFTEKEEIHAP